MPPKVPVPPLNYLRSFDAIGRHLSLTRAAEELHLTGSALSHQLGLLEERLGTKLFLRNGRGLSFTAEGRYLHKHVGKSLRELADAMSIVAASQVERPLVVSSLPTFATRFLLPRYERLPAKISDTEIRVSTVDPIFERGDVDCAIVYGNGHWNDLTVEFVSHEFLVLVCAPLFAARNELKAVGDAQRHTFLQVRYRTDDWKIWLEVGMCRPMATQKVLTFESQSLVIQAAETGLGLAVVDRMMVAQELDNGRLVRALPQVARGPGSYYFVHPGDIPASSKLSAFKGWILDELAEAMKFEVPEAR